MRSEENTVGFNCNRIARTLFTAIVISIVSTLLARTGISQAKSLSKCNPGQYVGNVLQGVAAISATDTWAVGYYQSSSSLNDMTLIEHWDGTQWSIVPSPNPEQDFLLTLYGVTAISASDIWAVGYFDAAFGYSLQTITLHWDGSQWSIISSPHIGTGDNVLQSVSAVSANDVWTVGAYRTGSFENQTLIGHWDGTQRSLAMKVTRITG